MAVGVLGRMLAARRNRPLPAANPRPLDHDAPGRPIATTEGAFRTATGELVAAGMAAVVLRETIVGLVRTPPRLSLWTTAPREEDLAGPTAGAAGQASAS